MTDLLIVDDQAINRKLLRAQLEQEGYSVAEATDGFDALDLLQREPVAAVISDILMPRMDGFRLCRAIREHGSLAALPFILYTSTYDSPSDRQLARTVGADEYVVKPAPTAVLLRALADATQKAGARSRSPALPSDERQVLRQYNEVLVHKLEERNAELQEALAEIRQAHSEIVELNRDLERRVSQRTAELEATNRELEAFSYSVSHDLRAPLRHIDGYIELLAEEAGDILPDEPRRYLRVIADASTRMERLIDGLLELSRTGRADIRESSVDLGDLTRETISALEPQVAKRDITWVVDALPVVRGDRDLLLQVFANLLGNAVKYTGRRESARIEIGRGGDRDRQAVVFVRDNGAGFDMNHAHQLFGVFQRLHRTDEFEGTGIGLATVRRIIERHGGSVWAEAAPGKGATFYFSLIRQEPA